MSRGFFKNIPPSFFESKRYSESKQAKKQQAQSARQQAAEAHSDEERELLARYGKQLTRGRVGVSVVELYEKGFVRVLEVKGLRMIGDFEKLVAIEGFDANIQKKSAAGRGAGFVLTGGLNMLASNLRGDMTLQIVTVSRVHSISTEVGGQSELESLRRLQTVGKAILESQQKTESPTRTRQEHKGISGALAELSELHQAGALSDEEFSRAKKKLLTDP